MSTEKRILIAFVASAVVFAVWTMLFPPPKPSPKAPTPLTEVSTPTETPASAEGGAQEQSSAVPEKPAETSEEPKKPTPISALSGNEIQTFTLENDVLKVEFTNRGACATSVVLKKYSGDQGETLDLVQSVVHPQRTFPLQMVLAGAPDTRLYQAEEEGRSLRFEWRDGQGNSIKKVIEIPEKGYGLSLHLETTDKGEALSLGTGMRDTDIVERENRFATWGDAVVVRASEKKKKTYRRQKIHELTKLDGAAVLQVGFEDTYFLDVFHPTETLKTIELQALESATPSGQAGEIEKKRKEKDQKKDAQVLQINLYSPNGIFEGELFPGPKEYDLLKKRDQGLEKVLTFGIFHPIAVISLKALRWIYDWVGNWGLAIILLTIAIRIFLFPLMHKSTISMRKMQKVQPKVKAIQEKYRKNKSDPAVRQKMNQETMELYKQEGVNPVGGCLPTIIQLPILFALYTLFAHAIELRHAPFIWWITDLSAKDPLMITPILMTASMWLQQKLAPQAGDPKQMKMMRFMPLIFGIMFLGFPSGLVLYWLTNNVVTIMQQEITLRLIGERSGGSPKKGSKGKKK